MPEWSGLQISVTELRLVFDRILEHVEHGSGGTVVLREDHFYSLPAPNLYDMSSGPPEATIGQLTESWDNLTSSPVVGLRSNWEFVWLGDVLRAIGHLPPEGEERSIAR
jgi:hypothetical protein